MSTTDEVVDYWDQLKPLSWPWPVDLFTCSACLITYEVRRHPGIELRNGRVATVYGRAVDPGCPKCSEKV